MSPINVHPPLASGDQHFTLSVKSQNVYAFLIFTESNIYTLAWIPMRGIITCKKRKVNAQKTFTDVFVTSFVAWKEITAAGRSACCAEGLPFQSLYPTSAKLMQDRDRLSCCMLAIKKLAVVTPEVNLRNSMQVRKHASESTLASKPRADITRSPKQGYQCPTKGHVSTQKNLKRNYHCKFNQNFHLRLSV